MLFFKNKLYFSVVFFLVLSTDILFKLSESPLPVRFITKPIVVLLLTLYFFVNRSLKLKRDVYFLMALVFFLVGDIFLLLFENQVLYIVGLTCFIFGKLFYTRRFSNDNDFDLIKLIPFLSIIFVYIVVIILLVYDNLGDFFFPTIAYLFASMLLALFAYLRYGFVDKQSFYLVMIGVFFGISSDSIAVLQSFYNPDLAFHEVSIMLCYGLFQYFVVTGITQEKLLKGVNN